MNIKKLFLLLFACVAMIATVSAKNTWKKGTAEWMRIQIHEDFTYDKAFNTVLDLITDKYEMDLISKDGGYIFQFLYPTVINEKFNATGSFIQPYVMLYGIGGEYNNQYLTKPYVLFDITAHEFTHLVTAHNGQGGLEYSSESGALNESFSDIMACVAEKICIWEYC